jgi:K+-sensing histidine kinase KdpD
MDTGFRDGVRATGRQPDRGASATAALAYLRPAKVRREIAGYLIAVAGSAALTAVFLPFRRDITPLSKGFGFLVVVVIAAWVGGLGPGIAASIVGFLVFNFFFIPPYGTFTIASPEHVVVLFVFLGLSVLISALLARARGRAEAAEARATELRILQELSGDLVARVPGPEAYEVVLTRLVREFGFASASLQVRETRRFQGLAETVAVGTEPGTLTENWDPRSGGRSPDRLPLSVGSRNLGLLVLQGDRPPLGPSESRVLRAFCDQLALVLERDRLLLVS